jgi:hypothetical protein
MICFSVLSYLMLGIPFSGLFLSSDKENVLQVFLRAVVGRCCVLSHPTLDDQDESMRLAMHVACHTGWIFSVLLALGMHAMNLHSQRRPAARQPNKQFSENQSPFFFMISSITMETFVAYVVALEAISTDLFGLVPMSGLMKSAGATSILFCGNFGIILINSNWVTVDGGKAALNVLEKMVNVTMMRGAQSGGVVTFVPLEEGKVDSPLVLKGIRSRVLNSKRTDLSKLLRHKIEKDACSSITGKLVGSSSNTNYYARGFFGHTRFATSSKASFEGTHPHQWTPSSRRRIVAQNKTSNTSKKQIEVTSIPVENYITHNGDLDFFQVNGKTYDLETVQKWLELATESKMPATVDSAAIAGLVDLLRTKGCFGLSARYVVSFGLSTSKMDASPVDPLPTNEEYERIGLFFEDALEAHLQENAGCTMDDVDSTPKLRLDLTTRVMKMLSYEYREATSKFENVDTSAAKTFQCSKQPYYALSQFIDEEKGASLEIFAMATIDAFFDNDLLNATKIFLANAKGSFGLTVSSTLDGHRQVCIAARGQPMSVAFYPKKGLICYGSEQAAVKAGMNFETPGGNLTNKMDEETERLDLDDLGGEICLVDWSQDGGAVVSYPNRHLAVHELMGGSVHIVLLHQSKLSTVPDKHLGRRMTLLEGNELVKPLPEQPDDFVLSDIQDIPRICNEIQKDWEDVNMNRLTMWNLGQCIIKRMQSIVNGSLNRNPGTIDILLTGCEVSLWLAEQFASDLQKSFPKLGVKAVSSNKILGLFGQDLGIPCIGFPMSQKTHDLTNTIVIIVSHSGGTFAPLACSNLLQSTTRNIFVVASEWDTQIGKQLRSMYDGSELLASRIFSTEVGVRPAEPCSLSVVATHQLLTNIFQHICLIIIGDLHFRHASGAVITETDLEILERCNRDNIEALEHIVGVDYNIGKVPLSESRTEAELRAAGDVWAEHILENAKAYIMSFLYIMGTVTSGYPLVTGLAIAIGLDTEWAFYMSKFRRADCFLLIWLGICSSSRYVYVLHSHHAARFLDSLIYFFLPQINITILRLLQGRNLRHRMVGRTVVIGDCPWVSQAADAFLSKIFANSYSIAGLNVLSGKRPGCLFVLCVV